MWINASDPTESFYRLYPTSNQPTRKNSRYDLDPTTFALLINDVQPLDGVTSYVCVLFMQDNAPNQQVYTFTQTETANLTLDVIGKPALQKRAICSLL